MQSLNNIDDPPLLYLNVGTEVSAKFKGAFCEAKISRVDKLVKCKVTYKPAGQQATISDEFIRSAAGELLAPNEYKIGSMISVLTKLGESVSQQAVLNKIIDQSSYTVIFNDGDEKTVRRSFIRFKGERHYLNSETLDNAPLNNPEHFLQPIKNSSDIPNSPGHRYPSKLSPSLTERTNDTKRTSNNTDDESFDESLYEDAATTPNTYSKRQTTKQETKKPVKVVKKAPKFIKHVVTSDDESLKTTTREENNDSSDTGSSDESSSSDDFPSEIKDRFVAQLYKFMDDRGTPMNRVPTINGIDIALHRFFIIVRRYGGYNKVCKLRAWALVYKRLQTEPNFPCSNSSNVSNLKCAYKRYLHPFEDFYRKLGSTMCDLVSRHTSTKSKLNDSHRSLQLFKNRYINSGQKRPAANRKGIKIKTEPVEVKPSSPKVSSPQRWKQLPSSDSPTSSKASRIESTDVIEVDLKTPVSNESLAIESAISSPRVVDIMDTTQQNPNEEITLFSMMRTINDNMKKTKQKEKLKEDVLVKEEPSKSVREQRMVENKSRNNFKVVPKIEKIEVDDDSEPSKSKRKAGRLSVSGSDDIHYDLSIKRKKSNSMTNKSMSSNTETNDETDEDMGIGPGSRSTANDNDLNEKIFSKSSNITFSDLEIDRVVDVKYAYSSKIHNYRGKILQLNKDDHKVLVHYLGWNNRYDEWIKVNRILRVLEEGFAGNKARKRKSSTKPKNTTTNTDLFIQPVASSPSPSQPLIIEPTTSSLKSSPTHKTIALLKSTSRSLSTSTCSSEQSMDVVKTTKLLDDICTSSSGSDELKIELNNQSLIPEVNEEVHTELDTQNYSSLLSIKEEYLEIETNLKLDDSVHNASFSSADQKSPRKSVANSRKNSISLTDLLTNNSNRRSLNNSRNNSPNRMIRDDRKSVDLIAADCDVSFIEDNDMFSTANSTLVTFDTGKLQIAAEVNREKKEKDTWDKICSLNNSFSKSIELEEKAEIESNIQVEAEFTFNKFIIDEQVEEVEPEKLDSDTDQDMVVVKDTHVVNKENSVKNEQEFKKNGYTREINVKSKHEAAKNSSDENILLVSRSIENNANLTCDSTELIKYTFNLNDVNLVGKPRIRYIEEQMRICRESYAKLKNEISVIDRKRKKLKRSSLGNHSSYHLGNTTSNEENSKQEMAINAKK